MILKIVMSLVAIGLAVARILLPKVPIDATTIALLLLALVPWLSQIFSAVELPGGWKFTFRELKKTGERALEAGLVPATLTKADEQTYSFQAVGVNDPNLALAGLRIELEKRLKRLADKNDIATRTQGIGSLLNSLSQRNLLSQQERSIIADMVGLLNQAVHGAKVDRQATEWAMDFGSKLLKSLDERIGDNVK